jgi:ComF family protein
LNRYRSTRRLPATHRDVNDWKKIIQHWVFPPTCLLCGDPGDGDRDLCAPCRRGLPTRSAACPRCAIGLRETSSNRCGACLKHPPVFDAAFAAFDYEEPIRHLVRDTKFHHRYAAGRLLGGLLAEALSARFPRPECLVPVPLHPSRYRQRGFNQSALIARVVARAFDIPLDLHCVRRARQTDPQIGLSAAERSRNVRNAFLIVRPPQARHIAIIDDVVTTGATVAELAKVLKRAGVERVEVWACARADRTRDS